MRRWLLLLSLLICCAAVAFARHSLAPMRGLRAEFFPNANWTGPASLVATDETVTIDGVAAQLSGPLRGAFSIRWSGYLTIASGGVYRFSTRSDDGSKLYVDDLLVVDNSGVHGPQASSGVASIGPGSHRVTLEYFQSDGGFELEWEWGRAQGPLAPVPRWRLSQAPVAPATLVAVRVLDWALAIALVAAVMAVTAIAGGSWTFERGMPRAARFERFPRSACLALFVCLAVLETWPLASNPGRLSRNDNGDTMLNEWTIAWVAHQAPRAPARLFDANIFYPERRTLAFSEAMIVQGMLAAPVIWLGGSPVLAYNLVLLAGFVLTGWAACVLIARWTGDWIAGVVSGVLAAFNAHNLTSLPHLQAQHVEFFFLSLMSLDLLLRDPRLRHAVSFAVSFTLQALTSYYLLVITGFATAACLVVRPAEWRRQGATLARWLAVSAGIGAILLTPYLLPYWRVSRDHGFKRVPENVLQAILPDYLMTPSRLDRWIFGPVQAYNPLFPGVVCLALAAYALTRGRALADARARMCAAFGVCGVVLSFGLAVPGYETLHRAFPPLWGIRAVSRFGYLGIVAAALLAGYGVAALRRRLPADWRQSCVAVTLVAAAIGETLAMPIYYVPFDGVPAIYRRVARGEGVVAELPLPSPRGIALNSPYDLNSTAHWRPMLNGYSGSVPASYGVHYQALRDFPSDGAIAALKSYGVRYVFVHRDQFEPAAADRIDRMPELRRVAAEGEIVLYTLE
jgi:hypothetical protein